MRYSRPVSASYAPGGCVLGLERARDRAVERVVDQRGLARSGHARDDGQRAERHPERDVLEVVLARAAQRQVAPARRAARAGRECVSRPERYRAVSEGRRGGTPPAGRPNTISPPRSPEPGPELDHVIGGLDEAAVVLDDDDRVAGLRQLAAEIGEPRRVARVQADGRLVEHVERADQLGAELVGEIDALRLAARQRARLARQREVAETDAQQERELGLQLAQDLAGDGRSPTRSA